MTRIAQRGIRHSQMRNGDRHGALWRMVSNAVNVTLVSLWSRGQQEMTKRDVVAREGPRGGRKGWKRKEVLFDVEKLMPFHEKSENISFLCLCLILHLFIYLSVALQLSLSAFRVFLCMFLLLRLLCGLSVFLCLISCVRSFIPSFVVSRWTEVVSMTTTCAQWIERERSRIHGAMHRKRIII